MTSYSKALNSSERLPLATFNIFSFDALLAATLLVAILVSACAIVYQKNYQRHLFSELQQAQTVAQQLQVEREQLILEESTWSTSARIQQIAKSRLGMQRPSSPKLIILPS